MERAVGLTARATRMAITKATQPHASARAFDQRYPLAIAARSEGSMLVTFSPRKRVGSRFQPITAANRVSGTLTANTETPFVVDGIEGGF